MSKVVSSITLQWKSYLKHERVGCRGRHNTCFISWNQQGFVPLKNTACFRNLPSKSLLSCRSNESVCLEKVSVVVCTATLQVGHDEVPSQGHRVPIVLACVGGGDALLQAHPDTIVCLLSVHHTHYNATNLNEIWKQNTLIDWCYLKNEDNNKKESIWCEQNSALLQRSTVAQEWYDEDKATDGNQNVGWMIQHRRIGELMNNVLGIIISFDDSIKLGNSEKIVFVGCNPCS